MSIPVSSFAGSQLLTPFHQGALETAANGDVGQTTAREEAITRLKAQFADKFRELASDPQKFYQLLSAAFGSDIDRDMAVTLRRKALQGDFSWLPDIEVVSDETLKQGEKQGLGAYNAEQNVIYLSESVLSDPELAQTALAEEIGHALDELLNTADTRGDEGEMFRRLLAGENLSAQDIATIRNENDQGVITVDGRETAVEFIFGKIFKGIVNAVESVGRAIGNAFESVGNAISDAWQGAWNAFKNVMASSLFQKILFVMQFIPFLAPVAVILRIASAAYQVYQGIKTGNFMQAAMGALSAMGGAASNAKLLGLSANTVSTLNSVSQYGQYGMAAYQAQQTGRIDGLIMTALNSAQPGTNLDQLKSAAELYQKAMVVKTSLEQGDELGALLAGASLAGNYVDDKSQWGQTLATIQDIGGNVRTLEQAIKSKDWNRAADMIMGDVVRYAGMDPAAVDNLGKLLRLASTAATVDQRVKENDWVGAGLSLMEAGYQLSDDAGLQRQLVQASGQVRQLNTVFTALQNQQYDQAATQLNTLLGDPLNVADAMTVARRVGVDAIAINRALNMGDLDKATALVQRRLGDGTADEIRNMLQLAGNMSGVLDKVQANAATSTTSAAAGESSIPFLNLPNGDKLQVLQTLREAFKNEQYEQVATLLNSTLGKTWSAEQWAEKLTNSAQTLESGILQAVKDNDWQQAARLVMDEVAEYVPVDPAVAGDVENLAQMAASVGDTVVQYANATETTPPTTTRTVETGQTLSQLVTDAYGGGYDPDLIQRVARYNGLADAHNIRAGQQLEFPAREALATQSADPAYAAAYEARAAGFEQAVADSGASDQAITDNEFGNKPTGRASTTAEMPYGKKIDLASDVAGYVATAATTAAKAAATHVQQTTLKGPVDHAINRLEQSGDLGQIEKANALREANRPDGLKGMLHPEAVEYNANKTLEARNQVLSDKSVIGEKLARDLSKASGTLDLADSIIRKAGVIGTVAGPVIGSAAEIAKLDENATRAEKITAGVVGAAKNIDNVVVGGGAGAIATVAAGMTGPGAVVAGYAAGTVADEAYKRTPADDSFNNWVESAAPAIETAVEAGLDVIDAVVDTSTEIVNEIEDTIDSAAETIDDIGDSITEAYNRLVDSDREGAEPRP